MNILLAEDDRNFGLILKTELEQDNHRVDLVLNGVDVVLAIINSSYDFVLLDLRMPRLNGTDALRIIKCIKPHVPVITFSGNAGKGEMEETLQCGALKCFSKPFSVAQLKDEIRAFFEN